MNSSGRNLHENQQLYINRDQFKRVIFTIISHFIIGRKRSWVSELIQLRTGVFPDLGWPVLLSRGAIVQEDMTQTGHMEANLPTQGAATQQLSPVVQGQLRLSSDHKNLGHSWQLVFSNQTDAAGSMSLVETNKRGLLQRILLIQRTEKDPSGTASVHREFPYSW